MNDVYEYTIVSKRDCVHRSGNITLYIHTTLGFSSQCVSSQKSSSFRKFSKWLLFCISIPFLIVYIYYCTIKNEIKCFGFSKVFSNVFSLLSLSLSPFIISLLIITYGLYLFSDRLKASTIQIIDAVKSRFLRKMMQLSPTSPTERTHIVSKQERLHKDSIIKNYNFNENAVLKRCFDLILNFCDLH